MNSMFLFILPHCIVQSATKNDIDLENGIAFDYHEPTERKENSKHEPHSDTAASFLEKSETIMGTTTDSTTGATESKMLNCDCEEYACHCRKQCFCKLTDQQYSGDHVLKKKKTAKDLDAKGGLIDHQFKCSCSFDGVGGFGLVAGGTMDCDCKVADCACEKRCACKPA